MLDDDRKNTLRRLSKSWADRDVAGVLECFSPSAAYFSSVGPLPGEKAVGHDAIGAQIDAMFAHDDIVRADTSDLILSGDNGSWRWRYAQADGRVSLGCDLFRFDGTLIALKDAYRKLSVPASTTGE